jgi:hypothetical protein
LGAISPLDLESICGCDFVAVDRVVRSGCFDRNSLGSVDREVVGPVHHHRVQFESVARISPVTGGQCNEVGIVRGFLDIGLVDFDVLVSVGPDLFVVSS